MTSKYVKRLVCLANSRKIGGRCVAGREIANGKIDGWVRPVSHRPSSELLLTERWYGNGQPVEVGDVFDIALQGQKPHAFQPENHLIDTNYHCGTGFKATYAQLQSLVDHNSGTIWLDGYSSAYGLNDQVPETLAPSLKSSLKLVSVQDLEIVIAHEWPTFGNKRTLRGAFSTGGHYYVLKITDPVIETLFASHADGRYALGNALLCVSLGEAYKDHAYKLIAAVIRKGSCGIV